MFVSPRTFTLPMCIPSDFQRYIGSCFTLCLRLDPFVRLRVLVPGVVI